MASRNVNVADASVAIRGDLDPFLSDLKSPAATRAMESMGDRLQKALTPRALTANAFGKGPDELARSFQRAADSADEAFEAVRNLDHQNLDTAKARKYADTLDEIGIEAQQTLADLRQLASTDPRFNTPQIQAAADQLDRVGREAADSARSLREIKGVGASTEFERMAHEAREAGVNLERSSSQVDTLGNKLKGIKGILVGLGLAVGTQQILSFAGDASEKFRDLEQSGRTINAVFGDSATIIEDWGNRAARAAGLSKVQVNQSASTIGQGLRNMGFDAKAAADEVVRLQQRATDLALAFGFDPADAILGVTALLRGEFDTIEKFGVRIKQADVNARVLALGLDTGTDAAKRHAEAVATLDLFYEQTAKHADRFANSQGDVSVKLAQARAEIDNGMAEFGRNVASIQLGAIKVADGVGLAFDATAMDFGDMGDRVHRLADEMGVDFTTLKVMVIRHMRETGESFDETMTGMEVDAAVAASGITDEMTEGMRATHQVVIDVGAKIKAEWKGVTEYIPKAIRDRWSDTRSAAFQLAVEHAKGILDGQNQIKVAFEALTQLQEEEQTRAQRISYLQGLLSSQELGEGLNDGRPGVSSAARALRSQIIAELAGLGVDAYNSGYSIGREVARGIYASTHLADGATSYLAAKVSGYLPRSEPKEGPLRGITKVGDAIVHSITDGIYANLGAAGSAASALAGALSPSFGAVAGAGGAVVGGGNVYNLVVNGVPYQVGGPDEMVQRLLDMDPMGGEGRLS